MKMLTSLQREVLETLVSLYERHKRMIKSKEVAEALGKDEGTVRNVIMWLKSLGLVESRTGPAGGYMPTLKAYEVIGVQTPTLSHVTYGQVIVEKDGNQYRYAALDMEIMGIFGSDTMKAVVTVSGNIAPIEKGDLVRVESVPVRKFALEGRVEKVSREARQLMIVISKMTVIPNIKVNSLISRKLLTVRHDMTVREVAKFLYSHGIRGAPIVDDKNNIIGFITTTDISMLIARGEDLDATVDKYMRKTVFTINEDESIYEAMRYMDFNGVGRLVVIDYAGRPLGIITRTDILKALIAVK
ncbi:conserved hypothetical protein [Aeropyrum pernix K1]|uniref:CBS domain-containing protein n=2 Tax=Aeropyrum pernix TaxID=56636 RepID=Q9YDD9_AERPE|nr:conserved hypothetical protein [Aeropyrum pernix K1]